MLLLQYTSRRAKHATLRAMSPERAHMTSLSRSNAQWRGQPPAGHAAASVHSYVRADVTVAARAASHANALAAIRVQTRAKHALARDVSREC